MQSKQAADDGKMLNAMNTYVNTYNNQDLDA
jgi:hypothetical protein